MDGFAAYVMCHRVTGTTFYTTHATSKEIEAANQRLSDNGLDFRFLPVLLLPCGSANTAH